MTSPPTPPNPLLARLTSAFLNGAVLVLPLVVTLWLTARTVVFTDGLLTRWISTSVPGLGLVVVVLVFILVGLLGSHVAGRAVLRGLNALIDRIPVLRLLHHSTKDILGAIAGDSRKFERPVLVALSADGGIETVGFLTVDSMAAWERPDHVCVLIPQAFNWAASLVVVPRSRVTPLTISASDAMAFIVSGSTLTRALTRSTPTPSSAMPAVLDPH